MPAVSLEKLLKPTRSDYPAYTGTEPCAQTGDPDAVWFGLDDDHPDRRPFHNRSVTDFCRAHCGVCPLLEQCMRYAVTANESAGIWGATTVTDRRKIRQMARWPSWDATRNRWRIIALGDDDEQED